MSTEAMRAPGRRASVSSYNSASSGSRRSAKRPGFLRTFQGLFKRSRAKRHSQATLQAMNTDQQAADAAAATASMLRPKNFFANERTFLSWLHAAILAGGLGLAILNFGASTPTFLVPALVFTTTSVAIMAYSLWQFWVRAERLTRQEPGTYDDRFATVCILVILFVGIGLNLIIKLYSPAA